MVLRFTTTLALLAIISSSSAQWQQQLQQGSGSCGNCRQCDREKYIPFCASDGRQETTYRSRCHLQCAQKCNPGLRLKFEGVCAEPYRKENSKGGDLVGSGSSWGWPAVQPTKRPYIPPPTTQRNYPTTTRRYYPEPTTTRRYYPQPTTTRRYYPQPTTTQRYYPQPTTTRRYYPEQTTRRQYPNYPVQTERPGWAQPESSANFKTTPTTSRPWWQQSQYGSGSSGYRGSRNAEDWEADADEY